MPPHAAAGAAARKTAGAGAGAAAGTAAGTAGRPLCEIICGRAQEMMPLHITPGTVNLTITSPPYHNAIDYAKHVKYAGDATGTWHRGADNKPYASIDAWLSEMHDIFNMHTYDATANGGILCIIIADEIVRGTLVHLPAMLLNCLCGKRGRWIYRDCIIWHKVTGGTPRMGAFIKHPFALNHRPNIMHESILILQKPGGRLKQGGQGGQDSRARIPLNRIIKREIANSIWNIAPVPPRTARLLGHPAPFPLQIPYRLAMLYSEKGGLVLDPFAGSCQTLLASLMLDRRSIGFEVQPAYCTAGRRRLQVSLDASAKNRMLGNWLVPAYHKEPWVDTDQPGFFETAEADLSSMIPPGYVLDDMQQIKKGGGGAAARLTYTKTLAGERPHTMHIDVAGGTMRRHMQAPP